LRSNDDALRNETINITNSGTNNETKIVGGGTALIAEYPWMAYLRLGKYDMVN
jgi:hypothetical protein